VRTNLTRPAAHLLEASADDIEVVDGHCRVRGAPGRTLTVAAVARTADEGQNLPPGMDTGLEARFTNQPANWTFPYGVHVVAVEVARELGTVDLFGYWIAHDCGPVINPMLVDDQISGGLAHEHDALLLREPSNDRVRVDRDLLQQDRGVSSESRWSQPRRRAVHTHRSDDLARRVEHRHGDAHRADEDFAERDRVPTTAILLELFLQPPPVRDRPLSQLPQARTLEDPRLFSGRKEGKENAAGGAGVKRHPLADAPMVPDGVGAFDLFDAGPAEADQHVEADRLLREPPHPPHRFPQHVD